MSLLTPPLTGALAADRRRRRDDPVAALLPATRGRDGRLPGHRHRQPAQWADHLRRRPCDRALVPGEPAADAVARSRAAVTGPLAVLTCLASPLAGLFLGLADRRRALLVERAPVATHRGTCRAGRREPGQRPGALFPGLRVHAVRAHQPAAGAGLHCRHRGVLCRDPRIRVGALAYLSLQVGFLAYPGAVGINVTRLAWVFAVPAARRLGTAAEARPVPSWPRCGAAPGESISAAARRSLGPQRSAGVLPSAGRRSRSTTRRRARARSVNASRSSTRGTTGPSAHIARHHRWPADGSGRPTARTTRSSTRPGRIDPASYHAWLAELAVGWVAVPAAQLDYASVSEAELVATGLPYLQAIWSNEDWTLYRVVNAPRSGAARLPSWRSTTGPDARRHVRARCAWRVRWSPYLVVTDASGRPVDGCVGERDGWTFINVPSPGTYRVVADFDGQLRRSQAGCSCAARRAVRAWRRAGRRS